MLNTNKGNQAKHSSVNLGLTGLGVVFDLDLKPTSPPLAHHPSGVD